MTWRKVDPYFARRIQLVAFAVGIFFGLDYLFTPTGSSTALTLIERAVVPLWLWGAVIITASAIGLFVEWKVLGNDYPLSWMPSDARRRWGWVSNICHVTLFAILIALTLSSGVDITTRAVETGQLYGWRTGLLWGGYAYINWEFIRKLGAPL